MSHAIQAHCVHAAMTDVKAVLSIVSSACILGAEYIMGAERLGDASRFVQASGHKET